MRRISGSTADNEMASSRRTTSLSVFDPSCFEYNKSEDQDNPDFLGAGGFAEVYKARLVRNADGSLLDDPQLVAIKLIVGASNPRLARRAYDSVMKEMSILSRLPPHQNIVGLIGMCPNPRHLALIIEYVNGGSLADRLYLDDDADEDDENKIYLDIASWRQRLDIAYQISCGIYHLHSNDPVIVHMDLKCENVLLRITEDSLCCKIGDFGLSKTKDVSVRSRSHASGGAPGGTSQYIAPERYQRDIVVAREPDSAKRVDIYSFGLILWEIKERTEIFQGFPLDVVQRRKETNSLPESSQNCPVFPERYSSLIRNCCKASPEQRPSTPEVRRILEEIKIAARENLEPPRRAREVLIGSSGQDDEIFRIQEELERMRLEKKDQNLFTFASLSCSFVLGRKWNGIAKLWKILWKSLEWKFYTELQLKRNLNA